MSNIQSSIHFPGALPLVDQTPAPGAVAPLALPTGTVLQVSVARGRRRGEAGGGAATSLQRPAAAAVTELLARGGGAEGALQGGGGAAGSRRGAEEHPAAVLHQLGQTGKEVCITSAAGTHP